MNGRRGGGSRRAACGVVRGIPRIVCHRVIVPVTLRTCKALAEGDLCRGMSFRAFWWGHHAQFLAQGLGEAGSASQRLVAAEDDGLDEPAAWRHAEKKGASDYGASAERFSAILGKKSERRKCRGGNALRDPVARRRADSLERLERVCAVHGGRSQVPGFGFRGSEKTTRTGSARNPEPATRNPAPPPPAASSDYGATAKRF